jgi:large subunit ribosomal protein L20
MSLRVVAGLFRSRVASSPLQARINLPSKSAESLACFTIPSALSWNMIQLRGFASKKHKAVIRQAKGFRGRAKNCFSIAIRRLQKSWQYAYRDRKVQKREWRKLWILRLNAGIRQYGLSYSQFIPFMQKANIHLNRKVLAELAAQEPFSFKAVVDVVKHQQKTVRA